MEDIFRGESVCVVFRCRNRDGEPEDMSGKVVDVVMTDVNGVVVFSFSTRDDDGRRDIRVEGNYLFCPLSYGEMRSIRGVYMVEIRVQEGDVVEIAQVPGVRILDSVTGKRF